MINVGQEEVVGALEELNNELTEAIANRDLAQRRVESSKNTIAFLESLVTLVDDEKVAGADAHEVFDALTINGGTCLRFAVRVTSLRRKTRLRPLVRRYWTGFSPAGFQRKVSECFLTSHPPFPSFAWRNPIDLRHWPPKRWCRDRAPSSRKSGFFAILGSGVEQR